MMKKQQNHTDIKIKWENEIELVRLKKMKKKR